MSQVLLPEMDDEIGVVDRAGPGRPRWRSKTKTPRRRETPPGEAEDIRKEKNLDGSEPRHEDECGRRQGDNPILVKQ
jgi:hypothetical protein